MRHRRLSEFEPFSPLPGRVPPFKVGYRDKTGSWGKICGGFVFAVILVCGFIAAVVHVFGSGHGITTTAVAAREPMVMALLCDVSDNMEPGQKTQIRAIFDEEMPVLSRGNDFAIVGQLSDTVQWPLHLHFKGRDPGHPDECRNPLVCTPAAEGRRRTEKFLGPLWQAARRCLEPGARPVSPIAEGIAEMTRGVPEWTNAPENSRRRLYLLTDGLMHTPGKASLYEREPTKGRKGKRTPGEFTLYTAAGKSYLAKNLGQLRNAEVIVLFIRRQAESTRQDYRVREWMERYLADSGAQLPVKFREIW